MAKDEAAKGVGLDVGTAFIVGARQHGDKINLRSVRNAYFSMAPNKIMQEMLSRVGAKEGDNVGYLEFDNKIVVIGDKALAYASSTHGEMCRPMKKGVMSPDEHAEAIMTVIVEKAIGKALHKGEICRFSVPAEPFDDDIDIVFHEGIMTAILSNLGYTPKSLNEGEAVCYSELSSDEDRLSGGAFSFGGGQSNGCVIFEGRPVINFSVARGGDWIDEKSFKHARMRSAAEMTQFKETKIVDLLNPNGRDEAALSLYYKHHVSYVVSAVVDLLNREGAKVPAFDKPVRWIVSGGTSLAKNFLELCRQEFAKHKLPFVIKSVDHASDPLKSTAKGCLIAARLDEDSKK
jgi:hypothetical protein